MNSRILAFLIGVVLGLLFMYAGASEAPGSPIEDFSSLKTGGPSSKGPHNENGNTTLDIYKGRANFHGHLEAAMDAFYEADTGVAPRPRIVGSLSEADIWVKWRDCSEGGANFVHQGGVDAIHLGRCAANPTWVLSHEMNGHGESLTHYQDECYPGLSIMCRKRWDDGHLTLKDQYDLRHVPNQRLDSTPTTTLEEVR